jgi:phage terminase Nu1 subunit (DNA packaging protein)
MATTFESATPWYVVNKARFAEFFRISLPTADSWLRAGCPVLAFGTTGRAWQIDLRAAVEWRIASREKTPSDQDPDLMTPKDRLDYWRAEREKDRHLLDQGQLIPVLDVEQKFAAVFKQLAQAVETFPDKMERERGISPDVILLLQDLGDELRESLYQAAIATPQEQPDARD